MEFESAFINVKNCIDEILVSCEWLQKVVQRQKFLISVENLLLKSYKYILWNFIRH